MTTIDAPNAHAIAINGTFDDCQDLVKALFADTALRRELNLSAMNSINFARIAAQIVYYVAAALALGAPGRRGVVRGADGQFRQYLRGAPGAGDGTAGRTSGAGDQRQRHPRALPRLRRHEHRRGQAEPQPEHGYPGREQFRAAAVRIERPQRRRGSASDRRLPPRSACCRPTIRLGTPRPSSSPATGSTMPARWRRSARPIGVPASWSIRTPRSASPPRVHIAQGRCADRRAGDRASRQIRRCRRARDRGAATLAAGARRDDGAAGTGHNPAQRRRRRRRALSANARAAPGEGQHERRPRHPRQRSADRHRSRRHGGDRVARPLGRCRHPPRAGCGQRRRAFPRAHGFQGHRAPLGAGDRRGDRGGRRPP